MIIDLIVIALLLISAGIAFFRGFIREVLTIIGVAGGLAAAYYGGPHLIPLMSSWLGIVEGEEIPKLFDLIPYTMIAAALAYGSIFIFVVIILSIISHMLAGWARAIGLGAVDRTFGVIFGILRGIFILALLYLPVSMIVQEETLDRWFEGSKTHVYIEATSKWMKKFIPEDMTDDLENKTEETSESVAKATREQIEDMDILGDLKEKVQQDIENRNNNSETAPTGYERDQRLDMQQLFNQNNATEPATDSTNQNSSESAE